MSPKSRLQQVFFPWGWAWIYNTCWWLHIGGRPAVLSWWHWTNNRCNVGGGNNAMLLLSVCRMKQTKFPSLLNDSGLFLLQAILAATMSRKDFIGIYKNATIIIINIYSRLYWSTTITFIKCFSHTWWQFLLFHYVYTRGVLTASHVLIKVERKLRDYQMSGRHQKKENMWTSSYSSEQSI